MTSWAPVSGPCYILWKHRSAWKASLLGSRHQPSAGAVAASWADPSPVPRAGRAAAHQRGP